MEVDRHGEYARGRFISRRGTASDAVGWAESAKPNLRMAAFGAAEWQGWSAAIRSLINPLRQSTPFESLPESSHLTVSDHP